MDAGDEGDEEDEEDEVEAEGPSDEGDVIVNVQLHLYEQCVGRQIKLDLQPALLQRPLRAVGNRIQVWDSIGSGSARKPTSAGQVIRLSPIYLETAMDPTESPRKTEQPA